MNQIVINMKNGGYRLYDKSDWRLIQLGNIWLYKENKKNESHCRQYDYKFNYHGIKKALCGKTFPNKFTPKRILVIQMK